MFLIVAVFTSEQQKPFRRYLRRGMLIECLRIKWKLNHLKSLFRLTLHERILRRFSYSHLLLFSRTKQFGDLERRNLWDSTGLLAVIPGWIVIKLLSTELSSHKLWVTTEREIILPRKWTEFSSQRAKKKAFPTYRNRWSSRCFAKDLAFIIPFLNLSYEIFTLFPFRKFFTCFPF